MTSEKKNIPKWFERRTIADSQQSEEPVFWYDPLQVMRVQFMDNVQMINVTGTNVRWGEYTTPIYTHPIAPADKAVLSRGDAGELISVTKKDGNDYCRILSILGMEEDGDPVAEVQRLHDSEARYQWLAGTLLAPDYGDNDLPGQQIGWRIDNRYAGVYGHGNPVFIAGPTID